MYIGLTAYLIGLLFMTGVSVAMHDDGDRISTHVIIVILWPIILPILCGGIFGHLLNKLKQ